MSAANATAASTSTSEDMRAHEPSMEEILASIRRIIADDDALPNARRERQRAAEAIFEEEPVASDSQESVYSTPALEPVPVEPPPAPVAEIRQLRVGRPAPEPQVATQALREQEDVSFPEADAADLAATPEMRAEEMECLEPEDLAAPLVSSDAASSVASHFEALAASMFINDSGLLQQYAQEMMRPMLKQWLDDNLPVIVERLVRAEIERVARGGRR